MKRPYVHKILYSVSPLCLIHKIVGTKGLSNCYIGFEQKNFSFIRKGAVRN